MAVWVHGTRPGPRSYLSKDEEGELSDFLLVFGTMPNKKRKRSQPYCKGSSPGNIKLCPFVNHCISVSRHPIYLMSNYLLMLADCMLPAPFIPLLTLVPFLLTSHSTAFRLCRFGRGRVGGFPVIITHRC